MSTRATQDDDIPALQAQAEAPAQLTSSEWERSESNTSASPSDQLQQECERRFGRTPVALPQPVRQPRVSEMDEYFAAMDRGEEWKPPPEEDGVWHEFQTPDGMGVRMFVPRRKSNAETFEEDVALNMRNGMTRLGAEVIARAWAAGDGRMPRIERPKMAPPEPHHTRAQAATWKRHAANFGGADRTYSGPDAVEEMNHASVKAGEDFDAYLRARSRTDSRGRRLSKRAAEARYLELKREAAALKDAALTLPDDPKRAERVETYERLRDQNATYVAATETRTVAVVNIERERAASANALRIMRSIWRTAPPPPKPPPQAFTNPRLVAFKANANLGLSAVEHAFGEAA